MKLRLDLTVDVPDDGYDYAVDIDGRVEGLAELLLQHRLVTAVRSGGPSGSGKAGTPKLEIVVTRHPDAGTNVTVLLDGQEYQGHELVIIDPGAGHSRSDWLEARHHALWETTPAAAAVIERDFDHYTESEFITDDPPVLTEAETEALLAEWKKRGLSW